MCIYTTETVYEKPTHRKTMYVCVSIAGDIDVRIRLLYYTSLSLWYNYLVLYPSPCMLTYTNLQTVNYTFPVKVQYDWIRTKNYKTTYNEYGNYYMHVYLVLHIRVCILQVIMIILLAYPCNLT